MGLIDEKVRLQAEMEETYESKGAMRRVAPPEVSVMKSGNKRYPKLRAVKALIGSFFVNKDEGNSVADLQNDTFGKRNAGKLQYSFYKILLVILYLIYGSYRYCQYEWNKMKLRIFNIIYNPSNTPQLIRQDVTKLEKIPKRLAAILEMKSESQVGGGSQGLMNDGSELVCWTVSAGIKHLMLYDYDGVLKKNVQDFRKEIHNKLGKYFGPSHMPKYAIRIPHLNKVYFNDKDISSEDNHKVAIEISLLSNRDGRETIADLTRTMADLCASEDLKLNDITMNLVDKELIHLVGPEPDLLLYFGPCLDLQGFPPWHIRLTEFHWEEDNHDVVYSVFIRGLQKYATCKINVGK